MPEGCAISGCSGKVEITYLGHGLCADHWDEMTAEEVPSGALRVVLGIPAGPAAAMNEETTMATEEQEKSSRANGKGRAKGKDEKTAKSKKAARVEAPEEDLVVFAFRLTEQERNAIHQTAGPAKASRFVRAVAVAFAQEDDSAFRAVVKEAREARG